MHEFSLVTWNTNSLNPWWNLVFGNRMIPLNDGVIPVERGCSEGSLKNVIMFN